MLFSFDFNVQRLISVKERPSAKKALEDQFFHTLPLCAPSDLPEYTPYHEYEVRKQRQRQREDMKRGQSSS